MSKFTPPISNQKAAQNLKGARYWTSNREWRSDHDIYAMRTPWATMYEDYASPIPKIFLGNPSLSLELNKSPVWIVRDGLIPLLSFFARFPKPEKKFRSKLLIHRNWLRFIPSAWHPHCKSYALATIPNQEFFHAPLPLEERKRWVSAAHLSPGFCSLEHLEKEFERLRKNPRLQALRKNGSLLAHFEIGVKSIDYVFRFQREVISNLKGDFQTTDYDGFKYFSDLRDSVVLDLNERLLCSDDAHLQVLLARGAILPHDEKENAQASYEPLSPYHGYLIAPLPEGLECYFEIPANKDFNRYLEAIVGNENAFPVQMPFGPVPRWIQRFVQSLHSGPVREQ